MKFRRKLVLKARSGRVGLARALSKLGYCSRARAFELAQAGRVRLRGKVCRDPESPVDMSRDTITVDGKPIGTSQRVYLAMNKPRGLVTTAADEKGRETVYGLLPPDTPWVAPAGRLDKASEGLLFLTNDSEWAAAISSPATHLPKTYHVQINAVADDGLLRRLADGIPSRDELLRVRKATVLRSGTRNSWLEIVLDEGKNRHIRRMLQACGVEVLRLVRVAIGPFPLGDLPKGSIRPLSNTEKDELDRAARIPDPER